MPAFLVILGSGHLSAIEGRATKSIAENKDQHW